MAILVSYAGESPSWPIKSPKQRKEMKGKEEREIRSILHISNLKEGKF